MRSTRRILSGMRHPSAQGWRRGFTLIEVMIASIVLVLAMLSAVAALQSGFRALDTARNTTLASQVMQSELERIRLLSWEGVTALGSSYRVNASNVVPSGLGAEHDLTRLSTVVSVADVAGRVGQMKQITITVSWRGLNKEQHSVSTSTVYSKNGLYDYIYRVAPR